MRHLLATRPKARGAYSRAGGRRSPDPVSLFLLASIDPSEHALTIYEHASSDLEPAESVVLDARRVARAASAREARGVRGGGAVHHHGERQPRRRLPLRREPIPG